MGNKCGHLFAKLEKYGLYASDLDPTAIGERWQAQHHHQLRTSLIRRILKTQEYDTTILQVSN